MNPFDDLLTEPNPQQISPELLEMLGHKASSMFSEGGVSLNDGIKKLAAENPGLNDEHIRRIVEFANTTTFQHLFEKEADKNIHFPVADPGVIIRDLKDGGSPAHDGKSIGGSKSDYLSAPPKGGDTGDAQLSEMFGGKPDVGGLNKLASAEPESIHSGHANPIDDIYDTHVAMRSTRDELGIQNDSTFILFKEAQEDFYKVAKGEVMSYDGAGLSGVISAVTYIAGKEKAAAAIPGVVSRLLEDGLSPEFLSGSLAKTAGDVINPAHPLVTSWHHMAKLAEERVILEESISEVDAGLQKTAAALKQAGLGGVLGAVGKGAYGMISKSNGKVMAPVAAGLGALGIGAAVKSGINKTKNNMAGFDPNVVAAKREMI